MKLSEHKELKKEILALPPKEKDKLLLRLVAKDKVLTEHLHFLLLEDEADLKSRVEEIKKTILATMGELKVNKKLNAKDVLVSLRKLSKLVNHFFKVTKASFEEVELKFFLFDNTIIEFKSRLFSSYKNYEYLFANYFVKSILITLRKFDKLHEDLQYDLKDDANLLLTKIYNSYMQNVAKDLKLPTQV
jgi:hypothetical protein